MSCVLCDKCSRLIDSDDDVECFIGDTDIVACERCRERMEADGELDVETNTLVKTINGETFAQFVARVDADAAQAGEP